MAAPVPQTFANNDITSATTSIAVNLPSGIVADDVVIVCLYVETTATVTATGYTQKSSASSTASGEAHTGRTFWHRATGVESGTVTFSWTGAAFHAAATMRVSGCITTGDPFGSPTNTAVNNAGTGTTTPAVATLTPDRGECLVFFFGTSYNGGDWTPPSGFTERVDTGYPPTLDTLSQTTPAATGSVSATTTDTAVGRTGTVGYLLPIPVLILPTVVAGVATIPAVTVKFLTVAVVAGVATIPAPLTRVIPVTVVAGVATIPNVGVRFIPVAVVAGVASIPTPTLAMSVAITASVVAGVVSIPTPNIAPVTAVAVAGVVSIPTPIVVVVVQPTTVAGVATIPTPTVSTSGNALVTPTVVAGSVSIPAPSPSGAAGVGAVVVAGVATVPSVTVSVGSVVSATTVAGSVMIGTPAVGGGASIQEPTVAGVVSIPTPQLSVGVALPATTVAGVASIPTPGLVAESTATVATVAGTTSIPTPNIAPVNAGAVAGAVSIPTPTFTISNLVPISSPVAGSATIPTPVIRIDTTFAVATVAGTTTMPPPTVTAGTATLVAPGVVQALASIPAGSVTVGTGAFPSPVRVLARTHIPYPGIQSTPPVVPPSPAPTGSWYALWDIYREASDMFREDMATPPVACPNDGEPLLTGPQGQLFCPFDGWQPS